MAHHYVKFEVPARDLGHADVVFETWKGDQKVGTLRVSKGHVEWFPQNAKKPSARLTWWQFAKRMD
jgi:hypothetical protein